MFTFYCIIFSKLSKNKSRKPLVLCLMSCLCVFISLLPNYVWHTQLSTNKKFWGHSPLVLAALHLDPTGAMSPWIGPAMDDRCERSERATENGKFTASQGQKKIAIILPKNRDTAIFNRLYIRLYIKFVANNGKNRDSAHAAISFCPCCLVGNITFFWLWVDRILPLPPNNPQTALEITRVPRHQNEDTIVIYEISCNGLSYGPSIKKINEHEAHSKLDLYHNPTEFSVLPRTICSCPPLTGHWTQEYRVVQNYNTHI